MTLTLSSRAEELRDAFDRGFAEARGFAAPDEENFLAIRVAGNPYAVRLAEITGLYVDRRIVPLPTPTAELLGVVGLRLGVVAVYSLRALLREPGAGEIPRWLIVSHDGVGVGFDVLEGYARVPRSDIATSSGDARLHIAETAKIGGHTRAVVSVTSLMGAIRQSALGTASQKER
jgi:purine-binding chemotaxis protein CheW